MTTPQHSNHDSTNARLKHLVENLEGGILVEDENRCIAIINQAFCDIFAIPAPPEALIGADCSDSAETSKHLFAKPDVFVKRIATVLREQKRVTNETLLLQDGRVLNRDYVPIFQGYDYVGHLWHYRDVTDYHRSRQRWTRMLKFEAINKDINRLFLQLDDVDAAVNQALILTGQLLDVSRVYVFRIRENERIIDNTHEWCAPGVTPEIANLQGLPFDEIFPSLFPMLAEYDLIAPHHIRELPDDLIGVLEPQDIETVLWMPLYMNSRIEGFIGYDETRQPRNWLPEEITMARILTESYARALEREQAALMLIQARDEAVRTAQLRAQFVANMSHEIRTPMTGILGMLELLQETELDDLQREFAAEALASSSRLLTIINDILDFSKLEAGQIVLEATPIDLRAIATEVEMTLAPQLKQKNVELLVSVDKKVPYRVFGDATRIRQVLMNLGSNAVKFTRAGTITLSVELVNQSTDVAYLRFSVQDTGIGISTENAVRIFDSFVQADGTTTRKYGGTGLGLSICKQLVELMGGEIRLESEPGVGSTFSFDLRLPIAQASSLQAAERVDFTHLKVALFDDNLTARYVLAQQLENWGIQVTQAQAPQQVSQAQPFDLVFMRYRARKDRPKLSLALAHEVVYVTDGNTAPSDEATYLHWPIDQSTLYNLLVRAVHVPQSQDQAPAPLAESDTLKGRILLADDYPVNTDLVRRALSTMNLHVDCVSDGQQVLNQIGKADYDLVLMDIHMPIMDGIEATQKIRRAVEDYSNIPILALTASVMPEEREYYLAIGMNDVVSKPFSLQDLREVVKHWLEGAS